MRAVVVLSSLLAAACGRDAPPPDGVPDFPPPPAIEEDALFAEYRAERRLPVPAAEVRAWFAGDTMLRHLEETRGIAPPVETTLTEGEAWPQAGARRWARQANGHYLAERVLHADEDGFRYQVWGYTDPAAGQVAYALGEFEIVPDGADATRFVWTYRYRPRSRLAGPFLRRFVEGDFAAFMERGMDNAERDVLSR